MCVGNSEDRKPKVSCYTCFNKVILSKVITHPILDNKQFCSKECLKHEVKAVSTACQICKKIIIKPNGVKKAGIWFCKMECWEKSECKKNYEEELEAILDKVNNTILEQDENTESETFKNHNV